VTEAAEAVSDADDGSEVKSSRVESSQDGDGGTHHRPSAMPLTMAVVESSQVESSQVRRARHAPEAVSDADDDGSREDIPVR
jgi:hypothetical protein